MDILFGRGGLCLRISARMRGRRSGGRGPAQEHDPKTCKPDLVTYIYLSASITRSMAGCFLFLILTQCFDRPACYGRSWRFETHKQKDRPKAVSLSPDGSCDQAKRTVPFFRQYAM
jgi:hypothetical protein